MSARFAFPSAQQRTQCPEKRKKRGVATECVYFRVVTTQHGTCFFFFFLKETSTEERDLKLQPLQKKKKQQSIEK